MTTRKAIVLNEDATNRDAEDILELINVKGARVVTLTEEHETKNIYTNPTVWTVTRTGRTRLVSEWEGVQE